MAALHLEVDIFLVQKPNQGLAIYIEFSILLVKLTVLMLVLEEWNQWCRAERPIASGPNENLVGEVWGNEVKPVPLNLHGEGKKSGDFFPCGSTSV